MRKLILLLSVLLVVSASGVNITNYPPTNIFSAGELFLLSSILQKTNFNLPGNYVASTSELNAASNSILAQVTTLAGTNVWTGTNTFDTNVMLNAALTLTEVPRPGLSPSNSIYMWVEDVGGLPALRVRDWNGLVLGVVRDNVWIGRCAIPGGIKKGDAIYNAGVASSNMVWISKAQANDPSTMPALGVAAEDIPFLQTGRVLINGLLPDQNTTNWPNNAVLYVSDSVAGALTNAIPIVPNIAQQMGFVQANDATNGSIQIIIGAVLNDSTGTGQTNWYFGPYTTNVLSWQGSRINGVEFTNGIIYGNGIGLTNLQDTNIVWTGADLNLGFSVITNIDIIYAGAFSGSGEFLTSLPATNLTGTIDNARLPGNVLTNGQSSAVTFSNDVTVVGTNRVTKLRVGGAAETTDAINVTGTILSSGQVKAGTGIWSTGWLQADGLLYIGGGSAKNSIAYLDDSLGQRLQFGANVVSSRTSINQTNGNILCSGTLTATNGVKLLVKPSFTTNFTCTTNLQTYLCNGTNQVITLPDAANVANVIYRFACTNGWGSFTLTNATGAQTIRDGTSLSFKQIGIGSPAFFSDGAHWWPAARTKVIMANAQFSCTTNIPLTAASTSYPVTFNSTDFNNSQGIALGVGTNGFHSKMWITNSGQYEFSPSIVINFGGNNTVTTWFKKDGVNIANSATAIKGAAGGSIRCVTIPFVVSVTNTAAYEIWCQSSNTGDSLEIQAAGGAAPDDYPASPSVICPVKKISDMWP